MLPYVEHNPATPPDACVIWLHGLGADGHDFAPIVPELRLPAGAAVRFVFPHAPVMPVTINGGMAMPAWYDILAMDIDRKVDEAQLRRSAAAMIELVEQQLAAGIDSRRIVLAGFSQGGAVAYEAALSFNRPLGGLIAMSTYFATAGSIVPGEANRDLPVLVLHGSQDPVVSEQLGLRACRALEQLGHVPEYHSYPMAHAVCAEEIADISRFLCRCLALN